MCVFLVYLVARSQSKVFVAPIENRGLHGPNAAVYSRFGFITEEETLRSAPCLGYCLHSYNMFDQSDKRLSLHKRPGSVLWTVKYPSFSERPVF
jgi:hypothetical protein